MAIMRTLSENQVPNLNNILINKILSQVLKFIKILLLRYDYYGAPLAKQKPGKPVKHYYKYPKVF